MATNSGAQANADTTNTTKKNMGTKTPGEDVTAMDVGGGHGAGGDVGKSEESEEEGSSEEEGGRGQDGEQREVVQVDSKKDGGKGGKEVKVVGEVDDGGITPEVTTPPPKPAPQSTSALLAGYVQPPTTPEPTDPSRRNRNHRSSSNEASNNSPDIGDSNTSKTTQSYCTPVVRAATNADACYTMVTQEGTQEEQDARARQEIDDELAQVINNNLIFRDSNDQEFLMNMTALNPDCFNPMIMAMCKFHDTCGQISNAVALHLQYANSTTRA